MSDADERPRALQMATRVEKTNPPLLEDVFAGGKVKDVVAGAMDEQQGLAQEIDLSGAVGL